MPILASSYHVLAPDYPGFGFTTVSDSRSYTYTFDSVANTIMAFLSAVRVDSYTMYLFDYGAPIGLRLALQTSSAVRAIIAQTGNAYLEGLGADFSLLSNYYNNSTNATAEQALRDFASPVGTKFQYTVGASNPSVIEPESYTLDSGLLAVSGSVDIKLDFLRDYINNIAQYSVWQAYFRNYRPPLLAV